eukprot:GEMP01112834.1.p1 GENE.GEMP01112834.1~~GEMP01112834.1.p1  ORF type:complete len:191 (+),score=3.57 GEMP01112834.1:1-573(+)
MFSSHAYIDSINYFLKAYNNRRIPRSMYVNCNEKDDKMSDEICDFNLGMTKTNCTEEDNWGYNTNSPCILLKLNKMIDWIPEPMRNVNSLPQGLQDYINNLSDTDALSKNVWVWCESEGVEIDQPAPGIPYYFYPYSNQLGYLAPFVMVRLRDLPREEEVRVTCRAWAANILPRMNRRPLGQLEINIKLY